MNKITAIVVMVLLIGYAVFNAGERYAAINVGKECREVGRFTVGQLSYTCDNDIVVIDGEPKEIRK